MACVALASLISTIKLEFLQPFPRVPLHDQPLIQSLFERITSLQASLEESSGSGNGNGNGNGGTAIKFLEIKIRDFALEAEDGIEIHLTNFLLAKDDGGHRDKASQELHQTLQKAAENAAQLLNNIINSTSIIHAAAGSSKQDFCEVSENEVDGSLRYPPSPRLDENKMVGLGDDCEIIKQQLIENTQGSEHLKLIWIVGLPGIGKTTLANSVYEDPIIKARYKVRGWITMPRKYNRWEILCNLVLSLCTKAEPSEITKKCTCELADMVRKRLFGWRFLIVLDNWWNISRAWYDILSWLRNDRTGSRILLTTTHFDRESYASSSYYVHNMNLLNSSNSWDIFFNILSRNGHLPPKFENIRSHEIVEKCDGLPQLIVTVAKRLSDCTDVQREGKRIEKELDSVGILDRRALAFLYDQLPHHLKVCFLYLGVFPKRSEVSVKTLFRLWVAEGFANSNYEAYSYLQELIDRSLVLALSWSNFDGKIKHCRIHSTFHCFCALETQKEGILCAVNTQQHLGLPLSEFANSCRWLSLSQHSFDYYVLFRTNSSRSIFFFCKNFELFAPPKFLRVLALAPPAVFLQSENHFMFLRYLHVKQWVEGLDDIVSINRNLQALIVSHKGRSSSQKEMRLGSKIWETAQEIRHVEVSPSLSVDPPPPSKVRESLQTLYWLSIEHCTDEVFSRIPNVKKLGIICGVEECDNLDNLGYLVKLETLMIAFRNGSPSGFLNLKSLPLNIKRLKLKRTCLGWGEINVISKLPHLEVLKLKEACDGSIWEGTEGNFCKLKILYLEAKNLVSWEINDDNEQFPCLEHLVLRRCSSLEAIPACFQYIITLKSIELQNCSPSVLASANEMNDAVLEIYGFSAFAIQHVDPIEEGVEDDDDVPSK